MLYLKFFLKKTIGNNNFNRIKRFKNENLDDYSTKSYSQEGEDMILKRIFEYKDKGFYIDVGAHHPKRFSNTYYFYKRNWNGINIDAMPNSMKIFEKHRPRDINIEAAINDTKEDLMYFEFNEPALNGFSENLSKIRNLLPNYNIVKKYIIETKTLDSILENLSESMPIEIDFITIDVEGLDFKVLKSLNLIKYCPKLILIEQVSINMKEILENEITNYLKIYNYEVYAKSLNTVFYIKHDFLKTL